MVGGLGERAALICDSVSNLIQSSPRPAGKSSGFCGLRKTVSVGAQTNQQCHNKHLFHPKAKSCESFSVSSCIPSIRFIGIVSRKMRTLHVLNYG